MSIDSARKQVEKTVNSFNGLNNSTSQYVSSLNTLTTKVKDLINLIETDYKNKLSSFEKDRKTIADNANAASQKLSDATDIFQSSLNKIHTKLIISLIINAITILSVLGLLFVFLK